jgi:hypothetical protein
LKADQGRNFTKPNWTGKGAAVFLAMLKSWMDTQPIKLKLICLITPMQFPDGKVTS